MDGLDLQPVSLDAGGEPGDAGFAFRLVLDAGQPYLDDHRPGGDPLFGTAMGIEAMARGAGLAVSTTTRSATAGIAIEDVRTFHPIVLHDPSAIAVVRARIERANVTACSVETTDGVPPVTAGAQTHFMATVVDGGQCGQEPRCWPAGFEPPADWPVTDHDVYGLFFHGPAFRVVRGAAYVDDGAGAVVSEWNDRLPLLCCTDGTDEPADDLCDDQLVASPRWIELCMQTAGLLEVAARSRMMIPHRIERIEWGAPGEAASARLFACARRRAGAEDACDVELVDADRRVRLRLVNYQTVPLPFPADEAAIDRLRRLFRR